MKRIREFETPDSGELKREIAEAKAERIIREELKPTRSRCPPPSLRLLLSGFAGFAGCAEQIQGKDQKRLFG